MHCNFHGAHRASARWPSTGLATGLVCIYAWQSGTIKNEILIQPVVVSITTTCLPSYYYKGIRMMMTLYIQSGLKVKPNRGVNSKYWLNDPTGTRPKCHCIITILDPVVREDSVSGLYNIVSFTLRTRPKPLHFVYTD